MKKLFSKRLFSLPFVLVFTLFLTVTVLAETYTATTMRLLRYEGTVEIVDSSGKSGLVMENIRLNSGESLHTGAASSASVGLDSTKIVTLDENTKVDFTKQSNAIQLSLAEGSFFLDVSEKLSEDQTMDVKTSTMTVGIRGTVVLLSNLSVEEYQRRLTLQMEEGQASDQQSDSQPASGQNAGSASGTENVSLSSLEERIMQTDANGGVVSMLGILEGRVQLDYVDQNGESHSVEISAGQKATLLDSDENGQADVTPEVDNVTLEDLFDAAKKEIERDPALQKRLQDTGYDVPGGGSGGNEGADSSYPANEEWTISSPVTVVAQSASKMFDGQPLTRTGDILVQGLPEGFTCKAAANGSRTDAGSGENPIGSFSIYNKKGEDVTRHFTNIDKVSGKLTIDPAPLAAWSGSASKVYDGTPLTCSDTKLSFSAGRETISYAGKNLSYVLSENSPAAGSSSNNGSSSNTGSSSSAAAGQASDLPDTQTLYGICGTVLVHGSNPLTGQVREIALSAGQKLTVHLSDKNNETSIDYVIETITEEQIPEDILRIYADNPDIMTQACAETMWDPEKLAKLIEQLPPVQSAGNTENAETTTSDVNGVKIDSLTSDNLMEDCTNVRITIDTEGTNYNNRPLNKEEAHYTPMKADPSIKIVPTASITDVGTVKNTYTIDWGSANKNNYTLSETTGTLTVTPASATVRTGSAEKEYDGTPLTNSEASISGLVHGETASVTATGSITGVGSKSNSYSIDWGSAKEKNYDVSSHTGTLKVTENKSEISIKVTVSGKTYDGKPLDIDTVVTSDDSVQTSSKQFKTTDSAAKQARNSNASSKQGKTSDASSKKQSMTSDSSSKKQVKTAAASHSTNKVTVEGLPSGFTFKAHITGSRTDAGTSELTIESYQILDPDGKDVSDSFSNVKIVNNTLTIDPAEATVTTGSASKEYDGTPLTSSEASISGIVDADKDTVKVTATGSITDVGIADNTYTIDWGSAKNSNYTLSENLGTLEVTESSGEITFRAPTAEKTYDGTALEAGEVSVAGLPEGFTFTATADGSQTDAGSSESTVVSYSIFDADGNDVTASFSNITTENGTLTVNPAEATVTTGSATKEYDGKELTNSEASISGLTDADKAVVTVTATGKITEVGTADNTYSIDWGTAKEGNYTVSDSKGSLEVTKNTTEITFKAPSASKTYDGTALKPGAVTTDGLPEGFTFTATADGSQTDAGSSESTVASYKILDAGEKDVTDNFANIKTEKGTLTVNKAAATVTTGSATKEYDGKELTNSEASITGLTDADKALVTVTATGKITEVGKADNTYSIDWGTAKEGNYTVSDSKGSLEVTQNTTEITFKAPSAIKTYDGTALKPGAVTADGLPEGFTFTATADGSQTDAGSSESTVASYKILDSGEKDVTGNFASIKTEKGTLTVNKASATVTTGSATKEYDGKELTNSEASISGLTDADKDAVTVTATGKITEVGTTDNTYSIDWGTAKEGNYTVSDSKGTLKVTKNTSEITLKAPSASKTYDGTALKPGAVTAAGLTEGFTFTATAEGSQTDAGSSDSTVASYKILDADEKDVTSNFASIKTEKGTLTVNKASATVTTGSATKEYDGKELTNSEASISGLTDADKDAVTVTATGKITEVGTTDNTYSIDWGTAKEGNYTVSDSKGTLKVTKNTSEITLKAPSASKTYDGTALAANDAGAVTATGLPEGFTFTATAGGSQTDAGSSESTVASYKILDAGEKDVTDNFASIKTEKGTLTVNPAAATVTTGSASKEYDGKELTNSEASISGLTDTDKDAVTITATGKITEVGTADNTYSIDWGTVKKDNYKITESKGSLEVTKNTSEITLKAGTSSKAYDGTALKDESVSVDGELPADHYVTFEVTGSQTDVGNSANTISSYKILNADEKDVTEFFEKIKTQDGTLTVSTAAVTITTESKSKEYDGTPLKGTVSISGLADADKDKVTVTATASITDVGSTESTYSISWGTVNSSNYTLNENIGTLEVTKNSTKITFTSDSAEKVYDGTRISAPGVTVEGLPEGYTYVCSAGGATSYIDAGTYDNDFTDMPYSFTDEHGNEFHGWRYAVIKNADGKDVTDYFSNINLVEGTLTIKPLEVIMELYSYDYVYDGTKIFPDGIHATYGDGGEVEEDYQTIEHDSSDNPLHLTSVFNLIGGGTIQINCDGFTDAGDHEYEPTHTFTAGNGDNYKITYENTKFTLEPLKLLIDLKNPTVDYSGRTSGTVPEAKYNNGPEEGHDLTMSTMMSNDAGAFKGDFNIFDDVTMTVSTGGGGPDAGTYTLPCTYTLSGGVDPKNIEIQVTNDTLTINKITAVVETGSASGPTGTMYPVTNDEASITGLADADKPYVTIKATGIQSSEGSSDNTYEIQWGTTEHPVNSENYIIEEHLGTLEMFNAALTPPMGSAVPSKKGTTDNQSNTTSDTGSTPEKDPTTGNDDDNTAADQTGDVSEESEQAAEQSEQTSENTDSKEEQPEQTSENTDSKEDQPDQTSENTDSKEEQPEQTSENTDSKEDQPDQTSENTDSKEEQPDQASEKSDSREDQPDRTSESSKKSPDTSEEPAKETSEESKKENTEAKDSDNSEKKDARKDSDDGNEAAPAEVPTAAEKKDQKDSEE